MSFAVNGKTVIVTGAANGIGLAIARRFAEAGANVMFADMDEARLHEELGDDADQEDSNIRCFAGDLREKLAQTNLISATIDAFDRVDILVNACRQVVETDPLSCDDDTLEQMLQQNLMTSFRLSQVIARRMISQAEKSEQEDGPVGSIINISSIASRRSNPKLLAYSVACAALDQMTRSMAVALAPNRIRVNSVAFGSVMSASLQAKLREDAELHDKISDLTPLGRIAAAAEVADAVQFLASEGAGFMTGQILTVDGGRTLVDPIVAAAH